MYMKSEDCSANDGGGRWTRCGRGRGKRAIGIGTAPRGVGRDRVTQLCLHVMSLRALFSSLEFVLLPPSPCKTREYLVSSAARPDANNLLVYYCGKCRSP